MSPGVHHTEFVAFHARAARGFLLASGDAFGLRPFSSLLVARPDCWFQKIFAAGSFFSAARGGAQPDLINA
jgi:hypothetical protein